MRWWTDVLSTTRARSIPYSESGFTTQQKNSRDHRLNSGVFQHVNNREMRFYASIGFSECYWPCSSSTTSVFTNLTITYYYDSANGKLNSATDYTPTGYVIKQFIHPVDGMGRYECPP